MEIRQLREEGLYYKQIGEKLGIDPRTVAKHCNGETGTEKGRSKRPGILSGLEDYIVQRMAQGVTNSVVILREIRARGYRGGQTVLREFMAPLRKEFRNTPVIRYETGPGEQAQADWGEFGTIIHEGRRRKLHCFVMTLGYSRYMYAEYTVSEALPCLLSCHERAFQYFGGFPRKVLYDNMATVVIKHQETGEKVIHPRFKEFATMLGFSAQFCRVRRAETKGKVESGVKYVRYNFWQGITFTSLEDLNSKLLRWLALEANTRVHGTIFRRPIDMLAQEELTPLVDTVPFVLAADPRRKVGRDCLVSYCSSKYSVPWRYANKEVSILESGETLQIFHRGYMIAEHRKCSEKHGVVMNPEHYKGIPFSQRKEVLGGKQILDPHEYEQVQKRSLEDYGRFEGGEF